MASKTPKKSRTTPISARLPNDLVKRMETIASVLSTKMQTTIRLSNVVEMLARNELPKLEKEYGIGGAQ